MSFEATPFGSPTGIKMNNQGYGIAEYGNDSNLIVMFYNRAVEDPAKSAQAGRKICVDTDFVKINHPGERLNQIDRPATDADKRRFQYQWSQYVHNKTQVPEGTPIDLLFPNNPSTAENLRALGIHTIEQCAILSSHALDNIGMGAQEYQNKAKAYLTSSEKGVSFHKFNEVIKKLEQENKILKQQMTAQKQQIDDLIGKLTGTVNNQLQPAWQPNHDAQSARINANHPTAVRFQPIPNKEAAEQVAQIDDSAFGPSDDI